MLKLIRYILTPLTLVYSFVITFRNYFFDKGISKTEQVNAKVISVGNLTVGGSGKTPTVIHITDFLKRNNKKIGILSRGYRRKSKGYLYVSDGKKIRTTVDECGDEMYLLSTRCDVPTAVCEKRVEGSKRFLHDADIEAIVLDDAYQHRWIHRDLDILVFDQRFLNRVGKLEQNLLPAGDMREPFSAIKRADIVIINRKFSKRLNIPEIMNKYLKDKDVYYGYYEATGLQDIKTKQVFPIEEFIGQKSLVVCGIARPFSFLRVLESNQIDIANKLLFNDHKKYANKEVQRIRKQFYDTNSYSVITTEKDAVKLTEYSKELDDIDVYALNIDLHIEDQDKFHQRILKVFN